MRPFLAVAVLFLAYVAYAEAQDGSFEESLTKVRDHVTSLSATFLERTKAVVQDISNSDAVVKSKNWLAKTFEDIQNKVRGQ